jgi:hypothetical protein
MNAWFEAGLKPLFSRRSLIVLSIVIVINLLYGFAVAVNPLLMYLSGVFLILYGFSRLLADFELPLMASFTPAKVDVSSSFEIGNVVAQVKYLLGLDGRTGSAYHGPTIMVFRKT